MGVNIHKTRHECLAAAVNHSAPGFIVGPRCGDGDNLIFLDCDICHEWRLPSPVIKLNVGEKHIFGNCLGTLSAGQIRLRMKIGNW